MESRLLMENALLIALGRHLIGTSALASVLDVTRIAQPAADHPSTNAHPVVPPWFLSELNVLRLVPKANTSPPTGLVLVSRRIWLSHKPKLTTQYPQHAKPVAPVATAPTNA